MRWYQWPVFWLYVLWVFATAWWWEPQIEEDEASA